MQIIEQLERTIAYLTEASLEVFSPNHDSYPEAGIQPFEGDFYKGKSQWHKQKQKIPDSFCQGTARSEDYKTLKNTTQSLTHLPRNFIDFGQMGIFQSYYKVLTKTKEEREI